MLRVRVLDGVAAEADGRPVPAPASRRSLALLGWLALHPGPRSRSEVAAALWPDVVDASARQSMRSALWSLRQAMPEAALITSRDRVGLAEDVGVDLLEFEALVLAGDLAGAVEIARGDLLAGLDDEWALIARDEHRTRLGAVLRELADQAPDPAGAVGWARRAAELEPLSEESARLLMRCLVAAGDRSAALTAYRRLVDRLRRALHVPPSDETWQLAEQIRTEGAAEPAARTRPGLAPLVGRDRELAVLTAAWAGARAGRGGLALVHGDPGIGKTRLVAQLVESAGDALTGAAPDLAGAPLAPWADICAALLRRLDRLPNAPWVSALAPLLPAHVPPDPVSVAPGLGQARLAEAVVALIEHSAPVLVVIEDVHAADDASLAMLGYVVRRIAQSRALVVATRRHRPARDRLATLEQAARQSGLLRAEVALTGLDEDTVARLVRGLGPLPEDTVRQVVAGADGNPLLAVEAARALLAGDAMPAGLRGAARAALARLPEPARELVRTLAVAGRELDRDEAAARAAVDVAAAMPPAEDEGLLEYAGERVRFRHALLRDAVYADLPAVERIERHVHAADHAGPRNAAEAAAHLRAAGRLQDAGALLVTAAAQARAVGALGEATDLLHDACNVLPDDPAAALALADVLAWRGRPADARAAFDTALALIERSGDAAALARAHLQFAEWHYGPICEPRVAVDACHRAIAVMDGAGVDAPDLRCQVLAVTAWCESIGGELAEVERSLDKLRAITGGEPDDPVLASAAARARCLALLRQGRFAEAAAPGVRAGELAIAIGRPDHAYTGLANAAFAHVAAGDLDAALGLLDRTLAVVRGQGVLAIEVRVQLARAWVLVRLQRLADAAEAAAHARRTVERLDAPDLQALVDAERGRIALRAGDPTTAIELLTAALHSPDASIGRPLARLQRAEALARLGALDDAEAALLDVAMEPVRPGDWPDTLVARMAAVEGLIAAGRGDEVLARRRFAEAVAGWQRRIDPSELGRRVADVLIDLGRPIIGLVIPAEELAAIAADLAALPTEEAARA